MQMVGTNITCLDLLLHGGNNRSLGLQNKLNGALNATKTLDWGQ